MASLAKMILSAAIAASIASPALAKHLGKTGAHISLRHGVAVHALASIPRSIDDLARTGGGSIGYNENLRVNHW
jgi:hypothetical protein